LPQSENPGIHTVRVLLPPRFSISPIRVHENSVFQALGSFSPKTFAPPRNAPAGHFEDQNPDFTLYTLRPSSSSTRFFCCPPASGQFRNKVPTRPPARPRCLTFCKEQAPSPSTVTPLLKHFHAHFLHTSSALWAAAQTKQDQFPVNSFVFMIVGAPPNHYLLLLCRSSFLPLPFPELSTLAYTPDFPILLLYIFT